MKTFLKFLVVTVSLIASASALADFGPITVEDCNQSSADLNLISGDVSYFDKHEFPETYVMFHSENGVWYETESQKVVAGTYEYEFKINDYEGGYIDKFAVMLKDTDGDDHYVTIEKCN